ncbi:MAG: glycine zipper 2TM domain-containing protein [Rhodanobacteraceae bacterium]
MNMYSKHGYARKLLVLGVMAGSAAFALAGCEPYPAQTTRYSSGPGYYNNGYQQPPPPPQSCYNRCGVVRDIRQVYVNGGNNNNATLGTVLGAVVGGVLGNQVGHGRGRTAATVGGAVAGGFAGHAIGDRSGNQQGDAFQIVVQLDNGQYATVTQREPPNVRIGDYVVVQNDHVYQRGR